MAFCRWPLCGREVSDRLMFHMCRPHWYRLPETIRNALWRSYRADREISDEHRAAIERALSYAHDNEMKARARQPSLF
jgi:hypothetical protein